VRRTRGNGRDYLFAWLLPINIHGSNFPDHPYLGLLVFTVSTVFVSIIRAWL
jgi:hypothetical protein